MVGGTDGLLPPNRDPELRMPLPLPNLDDRTYADLIEEARALIPGLDRGGPDDQPSWTNHNPSDPGITLIELFAWRHRAVDLSNKRVTDHHSNVPATAQRSVGAGRSLRPLDEEIRSTILAVRRRPGGHQLGLRAART